MRKSKIKTTQRLVLYSLLAIFIVFCVVELSDVKKNERIQIAAICRNARAELVQNTFGVTNSKLGAKASFVYDFTTHKVLSEKNAETALPLASLTKLMTVRVALDSVEPDDLYTITANDLTSEPSIGFMPGDKYAIHELLKASLINSSNNAAVMLARSTGLSIPSFIRAMNDEAQKLGLTSMNYNTVTGLDINNDTVATAFGNAKDVVMLLEKDYADHPETMVYATKNLDVIYSSTGKTIPLINTNKAISKLPLLVAGKTGYTDVAGGNLAVLWKGRSSHLIGAAVLGSTEDGRFADMIRIHKSTDIFISTTLSLDKLCDTYE